MSVVTDSQRAALRAWAVANPRVRRVALFGSRVKGKHRSDSDLDIAVELEPGEDSNATLAYWMAHSSQWKAEVASMFSFPVDLQWLDNLGTTKTIEMGIAEACETLYERTS